VAQLDLVELWPRVLSIIKSKINEQAFNSWFSSIRLSSSQGDGLTLEVPDKFFRDWLVDHYQNLINTSLEEASGRKIKVEFKVNSNVIEIEKPADKEQKNIAPPTSDLRLNTKYTFENFVVGPSNLMTHTYCLAVAQSPAKAYNPLFIYGGVGLGKTHLMQAIGHYLAQKNKDTRICYVSSETFTNQLIGAIQNRSTASFRQKYRNVDILLMDDIQFLAGKESTQEEFFHTFNALHDAHKQIVISSDKPPKEIPYLEERLVSRFVWGLVTDIQPPDLETRVAILNKKAEKETVKVPDEVIFFLADKIKSNIR
jgi:chromosomal replication initiator protein